MALFRLMLPHPLSNRTPDIHPSSSTGLLQPNRNPSPPPLLNHTFEWHPEPTTRPNIPTLIRVTPASAIETITEECMTGFYDETMPKFESNPLNPNMNDNRATVMATIVMIRIPLSSACSWSTIIVRI